MSVPAVQEDWTLSAIGLQLHNPDLPYERFEELCWQLGKIHGAVRFAIGDAIRKGEELYGEEVYDALEHLGLSEAGRQEYVRVSERVPRSVRRKELSWSHHRAVASLSRTDAKGKKVADHTAQRAWLKRASEENLSHHQLRDELRNGVPTPERTCRCCGRPLS